MRMTTEMMTENIINENQMNNLVWLNSEYSELKNKIQKNI